MGNFICIAIAMLLGPRQIISVLFSQICIIIIRDKWFGFGEREEKTNETKRERTDEGATAQTFGSKLKCFLHNSQMYASLSLCLSPCVCNVHLWSFMQFRYAYKENKSAHLT